MSPFGARPAANAYVGAPIPRRAGVCRTLRSFYPWHYGCDPL